MEYTVTAARMLAAKCSLSDVARVIHHGQTTTEEGEAFFREWCKGKLEYRWNEGKGDSPGRPEVCYIDRSGTDHWHTLRWSSLVRIPFD